MKRRRKGWQRKILNAFRKGTFLRAIGSTVYDSRMEVVCCTTDLCEFGKTHNIDRMDSGGSPRWRLK